MSGMADVLAKTTGKSTGVSSVRNIMFNDCIMHIRLLNKISESTF